MLIIITLLVLLASGSQSQLNYEGNPLTENTEYTAEESHYAERQNSQRARKFYDKNNYVDSYLAAANDPNGKLPFSREIDVPKNTGKLIDQVSTKYQPIDINRMNINTHRTASNYANQIVVMNETQMTSSGQIASPNTDALSNFLNSKTPGESQWALDSYLKNQQLISQSQTQQNQPEYYSPKVQTFSQQDNNQLFNNQVGQSMGGISNIPAELSIIPSKTIIDYQNYPNEQLTSWPQMGFQSRKDFIPGPRKRTAYQQRRPFPPRMRSRYRAQSRIGPSSMKKFGNFPGPPALHHAEKPVEIIYTKPPGFAHGPEPISNPPVPFEDASQYFPDSDHQPASKDVYYSQLWSQSYDPHYYNYIAKTGKIKPWLYGKLGKHEDNDFWSELYFNFKKHGMKNMMNPMFLLGLSIPALTLMLSALLGKRSFARSNPDYHLSDEKINELVGKVRWAIECYEKQNTDCWK